MNTKLSTPSENLNLDNPAIIMQRLGYPELRKNSKGYMFLKGEPFTSQKCAGLIYRFERCTDMNTIKLVRQFRKVKNTQDFGEHSFIYLFGDHFITNVQNDEGKYSRIRVAFSELNFMNL